MVARWVPVALVALAGCKAGPNAVSPAPTYAANTAAVSQSAGPEAPEPHRGLPNPAITPGERTPQANKRGALNAEVVKKVKEAYGAQPGDVRSEVVRLIPPELGGTDNLKNLFLTTPWFAGLKSRLDQKLIGLVKSGQITVQQAEADLTLNWVRATHKHYVRNYGAGDRAAARKIEDTNRW